MKKNYTNPALRIVLIEDADIITNSPGPEYGGTTDGVVNRVDAKQRGGIWDED